MGHVKHQLDRFRTINGQRYINAGDVLDEVMERYIARAKALKVPHRVVKHPAGFRQVFVLESRWQEPLE